MDNDYRSRSMFRTMSVMFFKTVCYLLDIAF